MQLFPRPVGRLFIIALWASGNLLLNKMVVISEITFIIIFFLVPAHCFCQIFIIASLLWKTTFVSSSSSKIYLKKKHLAWKRINLVHGILAGTLCNQKDASDALTFLQHYNPSILKTICFANYVVPQETSKAISVTPNKWKFAPLHVR